MRNATPAVENEPGASPCLSDELLFSFATGSLDAPGRARAEAHVADCAECRAVLAQAARGLEECDPEASAGDGSSKSIGRYRLIALLGAGAAGIVYRAFDPELERVVALKILVNTAAESAQAPKEQILREARVMAQLSHSNVVTVFDVGLAEEGVFIVMEYAPGTTLEHWLRAGARSEAEIVNAFIAAGKGLAAAHAKRLVHRDFKPENVLVSSDGGVKVTDFGLARSLGSAEPGVRSGLRDTDVTTRTHGVFGTPAYMAPELFSGAAANAASDQFSFCVALLGALIGHHPFGADAGLLVSELIARVLGARVDFSGTRLRSGLKNVLLRGLRAEPSARFPDMPALLVALERELHRTRRQRRFMAVVAACAMTLVLAPVMLLGAEPSPSAILSANTMRTLAGQASRLVSAARSREALGTAVRPPESAEAHPPEVARSSSVAARNVQTRQRSKPAGAVRYNDALRDPF